MDTNNSFSEYYKTVSNEELIRIVINPGDYQPAAVEAAKEELASRNLSDDVIQEARTLLSAEQEKKEKELEKRRAVENKLKDAGHTFLDTINPIQKGIPSTEKNIRYIAIVWSIIFLYQLIARFHFIAGFVKDIPRFPFSSLFALIPQLVLPVAIFTFWKRKTIGWILFAAFMVLSAVLSVSLAINSLTWKPTGFAEFDKLIQRPPLEQHLIPLLVYIGTIYFLCRKEIRILYGITKEKMIATFIVTIIVSLISIFVL